jgi:hypothetical protein
LSDFKHYLIFLLNKITNSATRPILLKPVVLLTPLRHTKKWTQSGHKLTSSSGSASVGPKLDVPATGAASLASALIQSFSSNFHINGSGKLSVTPSGINVRDRVERPIRFKQPLTPASTDDELILTPDGVTRLPSAAIEFIPHPLSSLSREATESSASAVARLHGPNSNDIINNTLHDDPAIDFVPESPEPSRSPSLAPLPPFSPQPHPPLLLEAPPIVEELDVTSTAQFPLVPPPKAIEAAVSKRHQKRKYRDLTREQVWAVFKSVSKKPEYECPAKTPVERYKTLLDEMFGPGDLYRGGKKPRLVSILAWLTLGQCVE